MAICAAETRLCWASSSCEPITASANRTVITPGAPHPRSGGTRTNHALRCKNHQLSLFLISSARLFICQTHSMSVIQTAIQSVSGELATLFRGTQSVLGSSGVYVLQGRSEEVRGPEVKVRGPDICLYMRVCKPVYVGFNVSQLFRTVMLSNNTRKK